MLFSTPEAVDFRSPGPPRKPFGLWWWGRRRDFPAWKCVSKEAVGRLHLAATNTFGSVCEP